MRTQAVFKKRLNVEWWPIKCLKLSAALFLHIAVTTEVK